MAERIDPILSARALERRAKRWWLEGPFDCFIPCAPGLEHVLLDELREGGFIEPGAVMGDATEPVPKAEEPGEDPATPLPERGGTLTERGGTLTERGGIELRLSPDEIMRANLSLRTASRVLLRLSTFQASSHAMLADHLRRVPWELHLGHSAAYALRLSSRRSSLQAGDAVLRTVSQAIERSMRAHGLRPRRDDGAVLEFHLRFQDDRCTVSLNTSGEHLHRRGVRRHVHDAPLRETVAAAVVLSGYRHHDLVLDPFCGSGTLLVEASDLVSGRMPGRSRGFAFEQAGWHRPGRWREVRRRAESAAEGAAPGAPVRIAGVEIEPAALDAARQNLAAEAYAAVELSQGDSTTIDLGSHGAERGLLLSNLPYGVRLGGRARAARTIERFLDRCLATGAGWDFGFLTMHPELFSGRDGISLSTTRAISSGGLKVHWVQGRIR